MARSPNLLTELGLNGRRAILLAFPAPGNIARGYHYRSEQYCP
jgi:hypothetical protein